MKIDRLKMGNCRRENHRGFNDHEHQGDTIMGKRRSVMTQQDGNAKVIGMIGIRVKGAVQLR